MTVPLADLHGLPLDEPWFEEIEPQRTAGVRAAVALGGLTPFFDRTYALVADVLTHQGVEPVGPAYARFYSDPHSTDPAALIEVEAGLPIAADFNQAEGVMPGELPGGRVIRVRHVGGYGGDLVDVWRKIEQFLLDRGYEVGLAAWEYYTNLPNPDGDDQLITDIYGRLD